MARFTGAETVRSGYYLSVRDWKLETVESPWGVLPGDASARYLRVPVVAMVVVAPLMGLLFVLLVPFIGPAVVIEQLWQKARAGVAGHRARGASRVQPVTLPRR